MTPLHRYLRFNLIGLLGAAVQLTTLATLNHLFPHRYLLTSTAAIELTLLHNIVWHLHYTWRDRTQQTSRLQQITRFHLTNGLTSLAGNLALMRLLVGTAHLPVFAANTTAILCGSLLNFYAADRWAFPASLRNFRSHTTNNVYSERAQHRPRLTAAQQSAAASAAEPLRVPGSLN